MDRPMRDAVVLAKPKPSTTLPDSQNKTKFLQAAANVLDFPVFLGLLAVIVLAEIPYGTVDAWWEAVFECAVFAITAIRIIAIVLCPKWNFSRVVLLLPLVLLAAFAFLQTVELT